MRAYVKTLNEHRRANTKPLTTAEKQARIEAALKADPERSDAAIAEEVGATHPTVGHIRQKLEAEGVVNFTSPSNRKSKSGKKGEGQRRTPPRRKPAASDTEPTSPPVNNARDDEAQPAKSAPVPEPAADLVKEPMFSDDGAQAVRVLAPTAPDQRAPTPNLLDAATDRATPDDVHVLDADLPTNFETMEQKISLDEKLGNLIFLVEGQIDSFVSDMRVAGRLPELFRRIRKLIDKLEAEIAADGDQTEGWAESAAIERATPTQEEMPPSPVAER